MNVFFPKPNFRYLSRPMWVCLLLIFCSSYLAAQEQPPASAESAPEMIDVQSEVWKKGYAVGLSTGTHAFFGLGFAAALTPIFNLKVGYNHQNLNVEDYDFDLGNIDAQYEGQSFLINGELRQSSLQVLGEYGFAAKGLLRLVGGFAFGINNRAYGKIQFNDNIQFRDVVAEPDDIGYIGGTVTYSSIWPYLGVGIGRSVPKKRVGIGFDVGTFYKGTPQLELEATNMLRNNVENEDAIERNIASYKWWPVVALRVGVRLN